MLAWSSRFSTCTPPPAKIRAFAAAYAAMSRIPVEVVGRDVEHGRGARAQRGRGLELEARQLDHPRFGQPSRVQPRRQGGEHRRRNVPGDLAIDACGPAHRAGERGDGALAVGAGDRDHPRGALRATLLGEEACEQLDVADDLEPPRERARHDRLRERHAGARRHEVDAVEKRRRERPGRHLGLRKRGAKRGERRRRRARVGDAHGAAAARNPARHREPGFPEPQHQHLASRQVHVSAASTSTDRTGPAPR